MRPLDPDLTERRTKSPPRARRRRSRDEPERRAAPRFPLANTEIRNHAVTARVLDLARGGFAIESSHAMRPGQRYTFTLAIGEHVETLDARVLWCRLRTTERQPNGEVVPVYRAGIERIRPLAETGGAASDSG